MTKVHDLGGQAAGPVDLSEHVKSEFDKNVNALLRLLMHPDNEIIFVDEMRRAVENLGDKKYFELSYYERWIEAAHVLLIERGVLSQEEIERKIASIREQMVLSGHA